MMLECVTHFAQIYQGSLLKQVEDCARDAGFLLLVQKRSLSAWVPQVWERVVLIFLRSDFPGFPPLSGTRQSIWEHDPAAPVVTLRSCGIRDPLAARDPELMACIKHIAVAADAVRHLTPAVVEQSVAALVCLVGDPVSSALASAGGLSQTTDASCDELTKGVGSIVTANAGNDEADFDGASSLGHKAPDWAPPGPREGASGVLDPGFTGGGSAEAAQQAPTEGAGQNVKGVAEAVVGDDAGGWAVRRWGRCQQSSAALRHHEAFSPKGTNANFARVAAPGRLVLRTYERGVEDETLACGTGVCAAALLHAAATGAESPVHVTVRGGDTMRVDFEIDANGAFAVVHLTGPADFVFEGVVSL
jgi:hypothetical protein